MLPAQVAPICWCYEHCSTNILLLRTSWHQNIGADILQFKKFRGFFKCLQHQYIGANWFAAPIYWRSTRRIKMFAALRPFSYCLKTNRFAAPIYWRSTRRTKLFAAPRLFGQPRPIQSAGVSGSGNRIIPRWRPN